MKSISSVLLMAVFLSIMVAPLANAQTWFDDILQLYQKSRYQKAFAASPVNGAWGIGRGQSNLAAAKRIALQHCNKRGKSCQIYIENKKQIRRFAASTTRDVVLTINDQDGKKLQRQGTIEVSNLFLKTSPVRLRLNTGSTLCTGTRTYQGKGKHSFKGDCVGQRYTGTMSTRWPTFRISSGNASIDVRVKLR